MELRDALRTTGAIREFRPDPVADDVLYRILDTARFAPSGGNRQGWHVVVLKDPAVRRRLRDLYLPGWYEYLAQRMAGLTPFAPVTDEEKERSAIAQAQPVGEPGFAERLDQVPVLLVLLADLRALAAVIALGKPVRQPVRLTRKPVEEFATVDRFDGPSLASDHE